MTEIDEIGEVVVDFLKYNASNADNESNAFATISFLHREQRYRIDCLFFTYMLSQGFMISHILIFRVAFISQRITKETKLDNDFDIRYNSASYCKEAWAVQ